MGKQISVLYQRDVGFDKARRILLQRILPMAKVMMPDDQPVQGADVLGVADTAGADEDVVLELKVQVAEMGRVLQHRAVAARGTLPLAEGTGNEPQRVEHVASEAASEFGGLPDHVVSGEPALLDGIGLDRIDLAAPGHAIAGLDHIAGGIDVRQARVHAVIDHDPGVDVDAAALDKAERRSNADHTEIDISRQHLAGGKRDPEFVSLPVDALRLRTALHLDTTRFAPTLDHGTCGGRHHARHHAATAYEHRQLGALG